MANPANRGIFLATSTFTVEARREASLTFPLIYANPKAWVKTLF